MLFQPLLVQEYFIIGSIYIGEAVFGVVFVAVVGSCELSGVSLRLWRKIVGYEVNVLNCGATIGLWLSARTNLVRTGVTRLYHSGRLPCTFLSLLSRMAGNENK
ncbi:MAG: hypothetical protein M9933_19115 [Chitinophagaceae bacterium]|nr:hypothetical protein [Chitinophagaceae bacterium]